VEVLGLVFAGTATDRRPAMSAFVASTLGLPPGVGTDTADMFDLPDGSRFAVAEPRTLGADTARTIGFLVADLDAALASLRASGVEVDEPTANDRHRYAHFTAPDGELYELVEER
jgi:catechol 2,3-dioxygenase-like lactoylglutathione lyase family enzyme